MLRRYEEYTHDLKHKRKLFSEVQKRIIACHQKYKCVGQKCNGVTRLPENWELDHIIPLCQGGTNDYNFTPGGHQDRTNNLQIICPTCHALKTQHERSLFYAEERRHKFEEEELSTFIYADKYYKKKNSNTKPVITSPYF